MTSTQSHTAWSNPAVEGSILDAISIDAPWDIVEFFATKVRLSGSEEERESIDYLIKQLTEWGVPHTLYEPECFISIPLEASVRSTEPGGKSYRAKTPAMSVSTDGQEITGELVYVPTGAKGYKAGDIFSEGVDIGEQQIAGKIVLTEGMAAPGKVADLMRFGAKAGIFINPGENIHEGICTTIWGAPDLDNQHRQPTIPVIAVNNPSGKELIELAQRGGSVALSTKLDTRWRTIPVLVADIPGTEVPEDYVLLHGHLDGWHVGVGDNATGDATMAEIARVFWRNRGSLARSLKIAWWSGHSHGRYAGSTWFADEFAIDLAQHCLAQVNCDSPGCRWTTTFNGLSALTEAHAFVDTVIRETTGITPESERPPRAGDYSFNSIGLTGFYMLSSTMSDEDRAAKGYYPVGGCGGNIQWHTEDDTLEVADKENLLRDIKVYAASILRVMNAPIVPFDFRDTAAEFRETLTSYQQAAGNAFDFTPSFKALDALAQSLATFYTSAPLSETPGSDRARAYNFAQLRLARLLIPVNYSRMPTLRHDPALNVEPLPDLAPALATADAGGDVAKLGVLRSHLTRGQNRLVWTLNLAKETVDAV